MGLVLSPSLFEDSAILCFRTISLLQIRKPAQVFVQAGQIDESNSANGAWLSDDDRLHSAPWILNDLQ
jgi:hypothetical protein